MTTNDTSSRPDDEVNHSTETSPSLLLVLDAQYLCDAAVQGDIEGIRSCLLGITPRDEREGRETNDHDESSKDMTGWAWYRALFPHLQEPSLNFNESNNADEEGAIAELKKTSYCHREKYPHVHFENAHMIQETPHVALRVLLLLPSWHSLTWRAIHATLYEIQQNRIVARCALSCLSEIRLFLSGCSCALLQFLTGEKVLQVSIRLGDWDRESDADGGLSRTQVDATSDANDLQRRRRKRISREDIVWFWKQQLISLAHKAARPLFSSNHPNQDARHNGDNQHLVLPLELMPSILSTAHRFDSLVGGTISEEHDKTNRIIATVDDECCSSAVAEICDLLFVSKTSIASKRQASSQASTSSSLVIVPFLTLAMDCAPYLHSRHWHMVQERILSYLNPSESPSSHKLLHPLDYAGLLRQCLGILVWFPSNAVTSSETPTAAAAIPSGEIVSHPARLVSLSKSKGSWEHVILQLYYTASTTSSSEPGILATMEMVLSSTIGQLPLSVTSRLLSYIQQYLLDLLALPTEEEDEVASCSTSSTCIDKDTMFWVCSNIVLSFFKSQNVPRRTFCSAASAFGIAEGHIIDITDEMLHTIIDIVHVKSLSVKHTDVNSSAVDIERRKQEIHEHPNYRGELFSIRKTRSKKNRKGLSDKELKRFTTRLSAFARGLTFTVGGNCKLRAEARGNDDVGDDECTSVSFFAFVSACAEVVHQSIFAGRHDFGSATGRLASSILHEMTDRGAAWTLAAFSMMSLIPKRGDSTHGHLLAIAIITCVFLEVPSSRNAIVREIMKKFTDYTLTASWSTVDRSEATNPLMLCTLCSVIVQSILCVDVDIGVMLKFSQYQRHDRDDLFSSLQPISNLITCSSAVMEHEVRNALVRAFLPLPSARGSILFLGRKLLTSHHRRFDDLNCGVRTNQKVSLEILLGLVEANTAPNDLLSTFNPPPAYIEGNSSGAKIDFWGLEAMWILSDIILLEKYALQVSDRSWLFRKVTELATTQRLPVFASFQLLRAALRRFLRFFVVNDTSSNASNDSLGAEKNPTLEFMPTRCFAEWKSNAGSEENQVHSVDAIEDTPGLLQMILFLTAVCDGENSDVRREILSFILQLERGFSKQGISMPEDTAGHDDRHSTVYSVAVSCCKALILNLCAETKDRLGKYGERKSQKTECVWYQEALATECGFEHNCIELLSKNRIASFFAGTRMIELALLPECSINSKSYVEKTASMRSDCLDVFLFYFLNPYKVVGSFGDTPTTFDVFKVVNYLLRFHGRSSDTDTFSKGEVVVPAVSFFNATRCLDIADAHYFPAVKHYCRVIQSTILDDGASAEVSVEKIVKLVHCLYQIHADGPLRVGSEANSVSKLNDDRDRTASDFKNSVLCALLNCLIALKRRLSFSFESLDPPKFLAHAFVVRSTSVAVEGTASKKSFSWCDFIYRLSVDLNSTLVAGSSDATTIKYQLNCIETALDVATLLLSTCRTTNEESEELIKFCEAVSTSLWTIACNSEIKQFTLLKSTLRLVLMRVPLFWARIRMLHFICGVSSFSSNHFAMVAAKQCLGRLKIWYEESQQGEWTWHEGKEDDTEPFLPRETLCFATAEAWSWSFECSLSALEQMWSLVGKSIRSKSDVSWKIGADTVAQVHTNNASRIKIDLERTLIMLCDILGPMHNVKDHESDESPICAELLSPAAKLRLASCVHRVARTMQIAIQYLLKRLHDSNSDCVTLASVLDSLSCVAALVDNSSVLLTKNLAQRTRRWFSIERKRNTILKKMENLVFNVENKSVLSRLPKVLFEMEHYESSLQTLVVAISTVEDKRSNASVYDDIFRKLISNEKKGNPKTKNMSNNPTLSFFLGRYVSRSSKSGNFGMAVILDRTIDEDDEDESQAEDNIHLGEQLRDVPVGPASSLSKAGSRTKRRRTFAASRHPGDCWVMRHMSVPRSRNKTVHEWLQTDAALDCRYQDNIDTFADLEDFLVPG